MADTLQAIARSLSTDVQTLSTVSHNVSNMHTPGFRAQRAVPQFDPAAAGGTRMATAIDQRDGALAQTGNDLDLALRGAGFFVVDRGGKFLLARDGQFRIDAERNLVTANGDRVAGYNGALQLPEGRVRVDREGQIFVADQPAGQLQIVAVADASQLKSAGGGAFVYDGELAEWKGSVVQGALEQANVDAADETVRLMELTRHAESVQRAISIYDKAMDTGVNQIGGN